jgi:hypothetical protein
MRPVKWLIGSMVVLFIGLGLTTTTTTTADRPDQPAPAPPGAYSHDELQGDAEMTERMSIPSASTGQNHLRDPQLQRSQDAAYLRQLEQHQADVDRMLARPNP